MKRLVVCCDGTWNLPDQKAPTNVTKLALAVADKGQDDNRQVLLYHRGVGTRTRDRLLGGAMGVGLSHNIRECYRFVVREYEPGDHLFLFGFSRGAYTARSLAGLIRNAGILRSEHADRVDDAYLLYRADGVAQRPDGIESELFRRSFSHDPIGIRFIGVWDTVGALGIPGLPAPIARRLWGFHDTKLSSRVCAAYHALAIDEHRRPFRPTLWEQQDAPEQEFGQVWFSGAHTDVGGGSPNSALSDIPLLWMVGHAQRAGLAFIPGSFKHAGPDMTDARHRGETVHPDPLGAIRNSLTVPYRLLRSIDRPLRDPAKPRAYSVVADTVITRVAQAVPPYVARNLESYRREWPDAATESVGLDPLG